MFVRNGLLCVCACVFFWGGRDEELYLRGEKRMNASDD